MTPDPKEVLALAADIVESEKTLLSLKARWEQLFTNHSPYQLQTMQPKPEVKERTKRTDTFAAKIRTTLANSPDKRFTVEEIAKAVEGDPRKVGRALIRLRDDKTVFSSGRGLYSGKAMMPAETL